MSSNWNVVVSNTGNRTGDSVVAAYFTPLDIPVSHPASSIVFQLWDFKRVTINGGDDAVLKFSPTDASFAVFDSDGDEEIIPGRYNVTFCDGAVGGDNCVTDVYTIQGQRRVLHRLPRPDH